MNEVIINEQNIQNKICTIRSVQVMIDRDLAELYQVETRRLNEQVKRNIDRFPKDFMFQLSSEEFEIWKSQNVMSNSDKMGLRRPPYAFTEQGVSMLSSVLKSNIAVDISVTIIRTFVSMRKIITSNTLMFERFERVDFENILLDKISDILDIYQKKNKVKNSLQALKKAGKIRNNGKIWEMSK